MKKPPSAAPIARRSDIDEKTFLSEYLQKNQPVIVTGAMRGWKRLDPEYLAKRFGKEQVQIYGDLFRLIGITSLAEYLAKYFGRDARDIAKAGQVPYVRGYCHLIGEERVPWADHIFTLLRDDWARPTFFPAHSFVLPFCSASDTIDPTRDWFPARGLFISGQGARTRLHADPWCSDALLCQVYGRKDFVMYGPSQAPYLADNGKWVDIDAPDLQAFPQFSEAQPTVRDTLAEGEIVLVPAGWYHHFNSISDSISLTWNFVHACRQQEFLSYLERGPAEIERRQLTYAYFDSPSHRRIEDTLLLQSVIKCCRPTSS